MDSKTAQKLANELQRRAAYSGKGSAKAEAARAAQRLADRIRKAGRRSDVVSKGDGE